MNKPYRIMLDNKVMRHKFDTVRNASAFVIDYVKAAVSFGASIESSGTKTIIYWPYPDNKTQTIGIVR